MGKIFDALEKSKKERNTSVAKKESPSTVAGEQSRTQKAYVESVVPNKKTSTVPSRLRRDKVKIGRHERRILSYEAPEVPHDFSNFDKNLITISQPNSFEAEQFKQLRTNLFFPISGKAPRSIIVTSAAPSEGKSFVSANLAISIAQSLNEHVLIMDCDIRRPSIHRQFGFTDDVLGLSEYLSKGIPLSSLFLKTKINKLSILPGGRPPHNPSELLSSKQMSNLLEELKERYYDRHIIIDSPPPKLTAETNAIIRMADGVLLVIEYGRTKRDEVLGLIDIIGREKVLGVILNKCDMRFSGFYGFGKYKNYSKYYDRYQ